MTAETSPAVAEFSKTVARLRSDIENIQRELDQAATVWRATLSDEKKEFGQLLQNKRHNWDEEEAKWQKQRDAYEQKIRELEAFFLNRLDLSERNAVRALNDLDDAWQRDKLQRENAAQIGQKEAESRLTAWAAERERLRQEIDRLREQSEQQIASAAARSEEAVRHRLQDLWDRDKALWEQTLQQTLERLDEQKAAWAAEQAEQKHRLIDLQQRLAWIQSAPAAAPGPKPDERLEPCLRSLETQVAVLDVLFQDIAARILPPCDARR